MDWSQITSAEKNGELDTLEQHTSSGEVARIGVIPDIHFPNHDERAVEACLRGIEGSTHIVILGDLLDCYDLSKFIKDPSRRETFQDELDMGKDFLSNLRERFPDAEIHFIEGNHEQRIKRYLQSNATALASLRNLELQKLLELGESGIIHHNRAGVALFGMRFKHGDVVAQEACYTAKREASKEWSSGASGHTHRLGVWRSTKGGNIIEWAESGCLCTVNPEYVDGEPNWQQGFVTITVFENRMPKVEAHLIVNGEVM